MNYQAYKEQLEKLRIEFSERIEALDKDIHHKEEAVEKDFAEQATQLENSDVLNALDNEARAMVIQIDKALLRIQNKTFGICEICGSKINEKRLDAIPFTSLCINCAESE